RERRPGAVALVGRPALAGVRARHSDLPGGRRGAARQHDRDRDAVSPRAEIRVNGTTVAPGVASPPLPLPAGLTAVMVSVTVPGLAPRIYAVALERGSDIAQRAYVKASNTAAQARF